MAFLKPPALPVVIDSGHQLFAHIGDDGEIRTGQLVDRNMTYFQNPVPTGIDVINEEVQLQLDLFDNQLSLTAWPADAEMPSPQITVELVSGVFRENVAPPGPTLSRSADKVDAMGPPLGRMGVRRPGWVSSRVAVPSVFRTANRRRFRKIGLRLRTNSRRATI